LYYNIIYHRRGGKSARGEWGGIFRVYNVIRLSSYRKYEGFEAVVII